MPSAQSNRPPLDVLDPENVASSFNSKLFRQNLQGPVSSWTARARFRWRHSIARKVRVRPSKFYGEGLAGVRAMKAVVDGDVPSPQSPVFITCCRIRPLRRRNIELGEGAGLADRRAFDVRFGSVASD
jgi:hypothetical protein